MLEAYGRDEGAALAKVALQHLFRVYPELRAPSLTLLIKDTELPNNVKRTLNRYGVADAAGKVSGSMMRMALNMVAEEVPLVEDGSVEQVEGRPLINEWAEELAGISYRRNTMERALRSLVINFLRMSALTTKDSVSAKTSLLSAIPQKRRGELDPFNLETIAEKLFWLELIAVINKHWRNRCSAPTLLAAV